MNAAELRSLLARPESPTLEFKSRWYLIDSLDQRARRAHNDELIKDILGLANGSAATAGSTAYLIIGADDDLDPDGVRLTHDAVAFPVEGMRQRLINKVSAACDPAIADLSFDVVTLDGNRLGVITVHPSPHIHETTRDLSASSSSYSKYAVFIRSGDATRLASSNERETLRLQKNRHFKQYRNAPPVQFGASVGGLLGGLSGIALANALPHPTWGSRLIGMLIGAISSAGLGAMLGVVYRQYVDVRRYWYRFNPRGRLIVGVFLAVAGTFFFFQVMNQIVNGR